MARRPPLVTDRNIRQLLDLFRRLPPPLRVALIVLVAVGAVGYFVLRSRPATDTVAESDLAVSADGYLFCFWNVENLFDDHEDKRNSIDKPFDVGFAENDELRKLKYDRISTALLRLNGGVGPDVIACVEVESTRSAEILMDVLNSKLDEPAKKYRSFVMKNLNAGRHIAPCVISRLPLSQISTKLHGGNLRILETHVNVDGQDLTVIATHWTSQLQQRDGGHGDAGRNKYARLVHKLVLDITAKRPAADVLVCGDFNTTPDDESVMKELMAVGDKATVRASEPDDPLLLDLLAGKQPEKFGTLYYNGKPLIYDHVCVSAGLLDDAGWSCDPESVAVPTEKLTRAAATRRQPWRFGEPDARLQPNERGYSDHFPVTVRLRVKPAAGGAMKPDSR